jgi:hypothetical protein
VRDHLISHGFMDRYIRWLCHGENIETIDNTENIGNIIPDESYGGDLNLDNDQRDVSENEDIKNTENTYNVESHQLDEIKNDI